MEKPGKGVTTSLNLRTKGSNKKQKSRFSITEITNQDFRKFSKKFNNSYYVGYKSKQVHTETTEDYFLLIIYITELMKNKWRV